MQNVPAQEQGELVKKVWVRGVRAIRRAPPFAPASQSVRMYGALAIEPLPLEARLSLRAPVKANTMAGN